MTTDIERRQLKALLMKKDHDFYVYIVECNDGSYYTGVTNDLERRLWEHQHGICETCYTYPRRPVELRYVEHHDYIINAIAREKQIKRWSRKKKEALFMEDWDELKRLSKPYSVDNCFQKIQL